MLASRRRELDGNSRKHCSRTSSKRDEKSDTIHDDVAAAKQTCHMIRITRIRYGFWRFLSDRPTAVLHFDAD